MPSCTRPEAITFEKEMGLTHAEFFRSLSRALGTSDYRVDGHAVQLTDGCRRLEITLGEESVRRIALMAVPVTKVRLTFSGYGPDEVAAAVTQFDRIYQRGGG